MENYEIDENGVIKQINYNIKTYDEEYVSVYDRYGELTNYMSYLRYGFLIGSIGKIPNSILDIGYGNGSFLRVCSNSISNCFGYDVSGVELPNEITIVDNFFDRHYEVITFFDSLEHFEDIHFIDKLNCDYICVSLPWCHNFDDGWFKQWKHRKPNEHLWHFNEKSLKAFMEKNNFTQINSVNLEDNIRKNDEVYPNILTAIFKKNK